jgi:glycosyltransferase involved in cell wall biosynthesis
MHVLFIHQNFPAQFGHIAGYLAQRKGYRCTFLSQQPAGKFGLIDCLSYKLAGGATPQTHYCSRSFENAIWHSHAIYQTLEARPDIKPDLIVAHSGFLSTVFLRELYDCPIVSYFEYYYRTRGADMDFRPDFPNPKINLLRARARNANVLLDLEDCDAAYSPTRWQRSLFPRIYQDKIRTIFDGIDTSIWRPLPGVPRQLGDRVIPEGTRVVTYVSRGMESIRGFDIFMKTARLLCQRRRDVLFIVVGDDRICYGGDEDFTGKKSFKQWVLERDDYDLSRFVFTGPITIGALVNVFAISDLHIYLTVPFVLSWSLLDALACGTTVLASATAPVQEVIEHGQNGLLADFFDIEALADQAGKVLDAPADFKHLGQAGVKMIHERYSMDVCLPRMLALYEDAVFAYRKGR